MLRYLAEAVNPYAFQDLVAKLLESMSYHMVWIAPKGKDGGLDLLAQSDPLGVSGPGSITRDCEALARRTSRRVTLIDGDALLDLWFEHFNRIDEEGRRLLPIRPVYYLDPDATAS